MNALRFSFLAALVCLALAAPASGSPLANASTTCDDYSNQADAQRGADTRDPDGDGVYCESLPCPCLGAGGGGGGGDVGADRQRRAEVRARVGARAIARARARANARARARRRERARRRKLARERKLRRRINAAPARIIRVIDGDTVRVRTSGQLKKTYTVHLLGIDTPETRKPGTPVECGGREATAYMTVLAFDSPADANGYPLPSRGVVVGLTTDRSQQLFDRNKRLLAYVDVPAGARGPGIPAYDLSGSMIAGGFSKAYTFRKRVRRYRAYKSAQNQARAAGRAVWSRCAGDFHSAS